MNENYIVINSKLKCAPIKNKNENLSALSMHYEIEVCSFMILLFSLWNFLVSFSYIFSALSPQNQSSKKEQKIDKLYVAMRFL